MPAVKSPARTLVTGANGYIATWLVRKLLERGYSVRGTVRSPEKGVHLMNIFADYGDKLEIVVVEDVTKDGAFDEAVKDIDAIEHTASPFHFRSDEPKDFVDPAVKGTIGVLESALKNGSSVNRIVITSSCASVLHDTPEPTIFSEADWNEEAPALLEKYGKAATPMTKYRASKTLAERAAWDFHAKHKDIVNWDLVCINPPFVFGPAISDVTTPDTLGTSALNWHDTLLNADHGGKTDEVLTSSASCWIDVRDVAEAHVLALEKEAAGGERIIVSAGPFIWQWWIDAGNALSPSPLPSHDLPKGVPGGGRDVVHRIQYDTTKAANILGIKYKTIEETTKDTLEDFAARGW